VWTEAPETKLYMRGVEAIYRLCAIRVASLFRTVSDDAALVIAGLVLLRELVRLKAEMRDELRGHQVDVYLTQVLSGQDCFRSYLRRFGHEDEDGYPECGSGIVEDARHLIFECRRFDEERAEAEISVNTLVPLMLENP
ncbi:hypothetical protein KR054_010459, partial [Drosophila jambulina]